MVLHFPAPSSKYSEWLVWQLNLGVELILFIAQVRQLANDKHHLFYKDILPNNSFAAKPPLKKAIPGTVPVKHGLSISLTLLAENIGIPFI